MGSFFHGPPSVDLSRRRVRSVSLLSATAPTADESQVIRRRPVEEIPSLPEAPLARRRVVPSSHAASPVVHRRPFIEWPQEETHVPRRRRSQPRTETVQPETSLSFRRDGLPGSWEAYVTFHDYNPPRRGEFLTWVTTTVQPSTAVIANLRLDLSPTYCLVVTHEKTYDLKLTCEPTFNLTVTHERNA